MQLWPVPKKTKTSDTVFPKPRTMRNVNANQLRSSAKVSEGSDFANSYNFIINQMGLCFTLGYVEPKPTPEPPTGRVVPIVLSLGLILILAIGVFLFLRFYLIRKNKSLKDVLREYLLQLYLCTRDVASTFKYKDAMEPICHKRPVWP